MLLTYSLASGAVILAWVFFFNWRRSIGLNPKSKATASKYEFLLRPIVAVLFVANSFFVENSRFQIMSALLAILLLATFTWTLIQNRMREGIHD